MQLDACRIKTFIMKIMKLLRLWLIISPCSPWRWLELCMNDQLNPLRSHFGRNFVSPSPCKPEFPCQDISVLTRFEPAVERKVKTLCEVLACQRKLRLCRLLLVFFEAFSQSVRKIIFLMFSTWISKRLLVTSHTCFREDYLPGERRQWSPKAYNHSKERQQSGSFWFLFTAREAEFHRESAHWSCSVCPWKRHWDELWITQSCTKVKVRTWCEELQDEFPILSGKLKVDEIQPRYKCKVAHMGVRWHPRLHDLTSPTSFVCFVIVQCRYWMNFWSLRSALNVRNCYKGNSKQSTDGFHAGSSWCTCITDSRQRASSPSQRRNSTSGRGTDKAKGAMWRSDGSHAEHA